MEDLDPEQYAQMKTYHVWTANGLTGEDLLSLDKAKTAIEEFCRVDLKLSGPDKD